MFPAVVLLLIPGLSGCALFVKQPRVTIADVRMVSLGLAGGTAGVSLRVDNPNRFDLEMRSFSYRIDVAEGGEGVEDRWTPLAEQEEVEREVLVPGRQEVLVEVPVNFGYLAIGSAVRSLLLEGQVRYRVQGSVRVRGPVGEHHIPFTGRGTLTP